MEPTKSRGPPVKLDAKALKAGEAKIIEDGFKRMIQVPLRDFFNGLPAPVPAYIGGKKPTDERPFSMWLFHMEKARTFEDFAQEYAQYAKRCGLHNIALPEGIANLVKQLIMAKSTGAITFKEEEIRLFGVRSGEPGKEILVPNIAEGKEEEAAKVFTHFYRLFEVSGFKAETEGAQPPYRMPPAPAKVVHAAEQPVQKPAPAPKAPAAPPALKAGIREEMVVGSIQVLRPGDQTPAQPPAAQSEEVAVQVTVETVEGRSGKPPQEGKGEHQAREWKPPASQEGEAVSQAQVPVEHGTKESGGVAESDMLRLPLAQEGAAESGSQPVTIAKEGGKQPPAPSGAEASILNMDLLVEETAAPVRPAAAPPAVQKPAATQKPAAIPQPPLHEDKAIVVTSPDQLAAAIVAARKQQKGVVHDPKDVALVEELETLKSGRKTAAPIVQKTDQQAAWETTPGPKLGADAIREAKDFDARMAVAPAEETAPVQPIPGKVPIAEPEPVEEAPKPEPVPVPSERRPVSFTATRERPTFMQKLNAPIHISPTAAKYMKRGAFAAAAVAVVALSVIGVREYMKPAQAPAPIVAKATQPKQIPIPITKPAEEVKQQEEKKPVVAKKAKRVKGRLGREMEPMYGPTLESLQTPTTFETPTEEAYAIVNDLLTGRNYEESLKAFIKENPEYAPVYAYINRMFKDKVIESGEYMSKVQTYKPPIFAGVMRDIKRGMAPEVILARVQKTLPYVPDEFKNKD